MDDLQRHFYRLHFKTAFLERKGAAFEDLFSRIMAHAHPGDFEPVRPYGKLGDLKCDGYRASDKTVFQCYGPSTPTLDKLLAKMKRDFEGAVEHWGRRMERWSLVHNWDGGLPAPATQLLADYRQSHPNLELGETGYAGLLDSAMGLAVLKLEDLFGPVPSQRTLAALDFEALRPVVTAIQRMNPDDAPPLLAPSSSKLAANDLSDDEAGMLRLGRRREPLVEAFFDRYPDPSFGEEIAQGFRDRYRVLKDEGRPPDEIFIALQDFAGGMSGTAARQAAVLAALSYFFERCDIFEDYAEGSTGA